MRACVGQTKVAGSRQANDEPCVVDCHGKHPGLVGSACGWSGSGWHVMMMRGPLPRSEICIIGFRISSNATHILSELVYMASTFMAEFTWSRLSCTLTEQIVVGYFCSSGQQLRPA
jgi:hypothetical protein